jgi:TatD DNase family protein
VASGISLELVDTHCHLNFKDFDQDRDQVVEMARENGITTIVTPAIDLDTCQTAIDCAAKYPAVYAAVGVHPNDAHSWTPGTLSSLRSLAGTQKVVAIGEIGLDHYREASPWDLQEEIFTQQLNLAAECCLPVIIHNRNAQEDMIRILKEWHKGLHAAGSRLSTMPGVLHAFSGNIEFAQEMVALGFVLGIAGPVTFHNSSALQEIVRLIPTERLLTETDAPYLSPQPYRGKRNEPANVRIVAEKIAELTGVPLEKIARITTSTAGKLYNWR